MQVERSPEETRQTRKPADHELEAACEEAMESWPGIWLHRWSVLYGELRFGEGRPRTDAFIRAFRTVRDLIDAGEPAPICCAEAKRLAADGGGE